ncbi:hypothetical protein M3Y97_00263400 [Aphelenchoides bicaudatus]|nr:hypothetical protein M3Y97_00263400 [Aphelenchoides bicaudatus]
METPNPKVPKIEKTEDLPTTLIIVVPKEHKELFDNEELKKNFADLFVQVDPSVRIDYLKGFSRIRIIFERPELATTAKLLVEHHQFQGIQLKAFFAQNIKFTRRAYQDDEGHLKLPPLEKQFLISPPSSPPVGWTQSVEMAPVVCDFDLMARLAAYSVEDSYEVHAGDGPKIVVIPCKQEGEDASEKMPPIHTPRPPLEEQ